MEIDYSDMECGGCEDSENAPHTCGKPNCCDGTGWTGDLFERCITHYVPHDLGEFGFIAVR